MICLLLQLFSLTVSVIADSPPVTVKFQVDLQYSLLAALGGPDVFVGIIQPMIPDLFQGIESEHITNVALSDADGNTEITVSLDSTTPDLTNTLDEVEIFVEDESSIEAGGMTIKTIPGSFSRIDY
ncbi:uncharacterized protein LOC123550254 [Mercenaria mercenaria]|uniref:uncharacterized protein LOC123550254 n=1 Tax=Mercenaria mercenaria TaxID=6596 RepID=UPI00234F4232|nr:uncharacterized protein LOC123550254 [Mercenaria mercenaria]